jgi:hypothetical protein
MLRAIHTQHSSNPLVGEVAGQPILRTLVCCRIIVSGMIARHRVRAWVRRAVKGALTRCGDAEVKRKRGLIFELGEVAHVMR